jgi:hypothetical protein
MTGYSNSKKKGGRLLRLKISFKEAYRKELMG